LEASRSPLRLGYDRGETLFDNEAVGLRAPAATARSRVPGIVDDLGREPFDSAARPDVR